MTSLRHQYELSASMVTDTRRHCFRSMANSVCHASPVFQRHYKLKFFRLKLSHFLEQVVVLMSFNSVFVVVEMKYFMKYIYVDILYIIISLFFFFFFVCFYTLSVQFG